VPKEFTLTVEKLRMLPPTNAFRLQRQFGEARSEAERNFFVEQSRFTAALNLA
jgi:hypothetical protein